MFSSRCNVRCQQGKDLITYSRLFLQGLIQWPKQNMHSVNRTIDVDDFHLLHWGISAPFCFPSTEASALEQMSMFVTLLLTSPPSPPAPGRLISVKLDFELLQAWDPENVAAVVFTDKVPRGTSQSLRISSGRKDKPTCMWGIWKTACFHLLGYRLKCEICAAQGNTIKISLTVEMILIWSKMKRQKLQLSKSQEQMIQETGEFFKKLFNWFKQLIQVESFKMPGIQPLDSRALELKCFKLRK